MATDGQIPPDDPDIQRHGQTDEVLSNGENNTQKIEYNRFVELTNLSAEAKLYKAQTVEIYQRIGIRIAAFFLATIVVALMFCALYHILHQVFKFRYMFMQSGAMIALVVAPVASISGITIALLFGVFRGYKDADTAAAGAAVAASVTAAKGS